MSRFTLWFVSENLKRSGWPKIKGVFRKHEYVDTLTVDIAMESATQVAVGLGAGRPEFGLSVLADLFSDNPWTKESSNELITGMKRKAEEEYATMPGSLPWSAFYSGSRRLSKSGPEIGWTDLGDKGLFAVWGLCTARGVIWGLTHYRDMPKVFSQAKKAYEETAADAIAKGGLAVSAQYPWKSLEDFYVHCETLVKEFESDREPLAKPATNLRAVPEVAARLKT